MSAGELSEDVYIVAGYLRGLVEYVRARGGSVAPLFVALGLSEEELRDPDRRIPHAIQDKVFEAAAKETGDANVGLHAGETTHLIHFGIIGQLALTCRTGSDLLGLHARYQGLIGNGVRSESESTNGELVLHFRTAREPSRMRHALEYTLSAQITLARLLAGEAFSPRRIDFVHEEPDDSSEQCRVFGCPVSYSQNEVRVYLPAHVLSLPLPGGTSAVRPALEAEARKRLDALRVAVSHEDAEIARAKQFVADSLGGGGPSIEETAHATGTSPRTLQRRLEQHGLKFRDIVDQARRDVAAQHIEDDSLSLLDVALLLGFSEQSAFSRAFRRWFGVTPRDFRMGQRPR
jgi:AraC-like DNA-binding protein